MLFHNRRRAAFVAVLFSLCCLASEAQVVNPAPAGDTAGKMLARANADRRVEEHEKKLKLDVEELVRLTADLRDGHSAQAKQKLDRVEKLAKSIRLMMIGEDLKPTSWTRCCLIKETTSR